MSYKVLILLTVVSVSSCMEGLKNKFLTSISDNVQELNFAKATEDLNEGLLKGPTSECVTLKTHSNETPDEPRKVVSDKEVHINRETFPPPKKIKSTKRMWGTNYYTLIRNNAVGGSYPLYDRADKPISHKGERTSLTQKDWCGSGIEGTTRIAYKNGDIITYTYDIQVKYIMGVGCKEKWMEKTKFKTVETKYGLGVRSYSLVPYRTIAVKSYNIPPGTLVYIPSAKGKVVGLPDGSTMIHDGYFFVGDTGGVLDKKGKNQVDFFTGGTKSKKPFHDFIKSEPSTKFDVQIVDDEPLRQKFLKMHKKKY